MVTRYQRRMEAERPPLSEAPLCACGCGERVGWIVMKRRWAVYRSGHNARVGANGNPYWHVKVNWDDPRWVYLLAAHLGDGCDHRRIDIAVGKDVGWDKALEAVMGRVGLNPSTLKTTMRVRASSIPVMREFAKFKQGGRDGKWMFPFLPSPIPVFLAGLLDSDGGIYPDGGVIIFQRDNGNLDRLAALLREAGETRIHLGRDVRDGVAILGGREIRLGTSVRLGIRNTLREEVLAHCLNPVRLGQWAVYRAKHKPWAESYPRKHKE
jgi:hypothetical protein